MAGLFLGISLYAGVGIEPLDILGMVAQALVGQLAPQYSGVLEVLLIVMTMVGFWQTFTLILSGKAFGIGGLIMTVAGFIGGLILVFIPMAGIVGIIVSYLIGAAM